jgi:hypothetical protein
MSKKPTFKQEWVLAFTFNNMIYDGRLSRDASSPFSGSTQSEMIRFLNRMVDAGWLFPCERGSFWSLTEKSVAWLANNKLDTPSGYQEKYFAKIKIKNSQQ